MAAEPRTRRGRCTTRNYKSQRAPRGRRKRPGTAADWARKPAPGRRACGRRDVWSSRATKYRASSSGLGAGLLASPRLCIPICGAGSLRHEVGGLDLEAQPDLKDLRGSAAATQGSRRAWTREPRTEGSAPRSRTAHGDCREEPRPWTPRLDPHLLGRRPKPFRRGPYGDGSPERPAVELKVRGHAPCWGWREGGETGPHLLQDDRLQSVLPADPAPQPPTG